MKKNKIHTADVGKDSAVKKSEKSTASLSLVLFLLDKLSNAIYHALCNGFFGKLFTAYSKEQESFENGFLKNHFISTKFKVFFRKIRQYISKSFENSWFLNKTKSTSRSWLSVPLKSYGKAIFFFGVYTVLVYLIRLVIPSLNRSDVGYVLTGLAACIVALPTFRSKESLARALDSGVLTNMLCSDFFGYRKECFELPRKPSRAKNNILIFIGMIFGMLTLFVHPLLLLVFLLLILAFIIILNTPEIGVLLSLFFIPFLSFFDIPATILGIVVMLTAISYFIKLIRGKRLLQIELMDLSVFLFFLLLFFSGTITVGGKQGFEEVLLSCCLMLGYFLTVNLMRTELWLKRCVLALVSSGTIVAVWGIIQYFFAAVHVDAWVDEEYFPDISGRAVSFFDNPNVLASYLVLILPFVLLMFLFAKRGREKTLYFISLISVLACVVLTWSRGAWLAVIACLLVFGLIYSKKTLRSIFLFALTIPFWTMFLPQSITKRFLSIGNLADSSTSYRYYTWKGSWSLIQEHFMGGIGYGTTAYQEVYPQFAYAGMEAAEHSHSLFLQILIGLGIAGLLSFFCVLFLSAQMNFEYLKKSNNERARILVIASMCSILGALVMGLFDFIWYNYRIFFLFWAILGLACACIRVGQAEENRHVYIESDETNTATMDLDF